MRKGGATLFSSSDAYLTMAVSSTQLDTTLAQGLLHLEFNLLERSVGHAPASGTFPISLTKAVWHQQRPSWTGSSSFTFSLPRHHGRLPSLALVIVASLVGVSTRFEGRHGFLSWLMGRHNPSAWSGPHTV